MGGWEDGAEGGWKRGGPIISDGHNRSAEQGREDGPASLAMCAFEDKAKALGRDMLSKAPRVFFKPKAKWYNRMLAERGLVTLYWTLREYVSGDKACSGEAGVRFKGTYNLG